MPGKTPATPVCPSCGNTITTRHCTSPTCTWWKCAASRCKAVFTTTGKFYRRAAA